MLCPLRHLSIGKKESVLEHIILLLSMLVLNLSVHCLQANDIVINRYTNLIFENVSIFLNIFFVLLKFDNELFSVDNEPRYHVYLV